MKFLLFIFVGLSSLSCFAHNTLESRKLEIQGLAKSTDPKSIPGFVTDKPPETSLNEVHALEGAAERAFVNNKIAKDLKEISETRKYFVLDADKDPIFVNSKEASIKPAAFLKGTMSNRKPQTTYEWQTCRESKPKTELKCSKILMEPTINIEPAKYTNYWCSRGNHQPDDPRCRAKKYFSPARKYKDEVITVTDEDWTNGCHAMEKKVQKGICRKIKSVCPKGEETKEIKVIFGDKTVSKMITRPCWRFEETYECSHPSPNNCEPLRQVSCEQMRSKCVTKIGGECVEWEQDYRCPKDVLPDDKEVIAESGYVMPGVDTNLSYTENNEINEAIAKLSIFQEMQGEMRSDASLNSITVFKGEAKACTIGFANFKNCCTKKGWGSSVGLQGCDEKDLELAEKNERRLCIEVGSYCAQKLAGVCIRKKRSSCCFPSKLSRIVHEQGRPQLGIGWGDPKSPDCRGFTPEELSRLDFDRLNLSELFEEIASRINKVSSKVVKRNLTDRIKTMTDGLGNQTESGDF